MNADQSPSESFQQSKSNFHLLVLDIAWFGLAVPATSQFLSVYAIRLDASPALLGWLAALPAIMALITSSFAQWWRHKYPSLVQAFIWPALAFRLAFLLPALTPYVPHEWQPAWLVFAVALPALPQGISSVLFLVMLREAIEDHRTLTTLMSRRSMVFNVNVAVGTLGFGFWLENVAFPINYQIMFLAAFGLSMLSFWAAIRVRVLADEPPPSPDRKPVGPWRSPAFRRVAFTTIITHIAMFMLIPLVPLRIVNDLGGDEGFMSLFALAGTAAAALMATQTSRIVARIGSQTAVATGMVTSALAGAMIAVTPTTWPTLVASAIGGAGWTMAAISLFANFSESAPPDNLTRFTTVYNQIVMLSVFVGPVLGSGLASASLDLGLVMLLGSGARLLAGVVVMGDGLNSWARARRPALPDPTH